MGEKYIFLANSSSFLINYKSSLSNILISQGKKVVWIFPRSKEDLSSINKKIIIDDFNHNNNLILFNFIILFKLLLVSFENKKIYIISHTAYCNLLTIFAFFFIKKKNFKINIFVSGFGPSRIRNSLRIRLIGRIYLFLLRFSTRSKNVKIFTLNLTDYHLIKDFNTKRKVILVRESGIMGEDINNGLVAQSKRNKITKKHILKVGFFGRFLIEKGLLDFIEMIKISLEIGLKFEFYICGSEDKNNSSSINLKLIKSKLKNTNTKIIINRDYKEIFNDINILIFPSMREGHPLYLLRSLAFGVVPIIYPNPGLTRDVIDGFNGIVTLGRYPTCLLSSLKRLDDDRNFLRKLSNNAVKYAATKQQTKADNELLDHIMMD